MEIKGQIVPVAGVDGISTMSLPQSARLASGPAKNSFHGWDFSLLVGRPFSPTESKKACAEDIDYIFEDWNLLVWFDDFSLI